MFEGEIMTYNNIKQALFINRINRFVAEIDIDGKRELCHVKNTGRLRELLVKDAKVYVEEHDSAERKTKFSLVAVQKGERVVNIDSQAPNKVFCEWAQNGGFLDGVTLIKPETTFGNSRFDCYIETDKGEKAFVEVKGVTLEDGGVAMFPDAPTERGVKHLKELCRCIDEGYLAYIVFVIKMKGVHTFTPNRKTHIEFAQALEKCQKKGVNIVCVDCNVTPDSLEISERIGIKF